MSNIVAIDNFTVTSQEFVIPGGALITSVAPQAVLTLSPNQGYQIEASNFTVISSNPEVDVPNSYFTQDGVNVILTVVFVSTATMPNNNLDIKICMRGVAEELGVTIAGKVFYDTANAIPLPTPNGVDYTNSGPAESTEEILSQLVQADAGYYFQSTPTISLRTGDPTDYNLYITDPVFDSNNRLTAVRVNADYTYPFVNHSGDEIDVYGHAIEIPVIPVNVTGYSISTTVPVTQTFRDLAILGVYGADYELTIDNGATFVSSGTNTVSGIVPAGNAVEQINFPAVGVSGGTHTLTFVPSGSDLDPSQPSSYWTITFDRFNRSNIVINGTVSTSDSEIVVDNSNSQTLVSNSQDLQVRYIDHIIEPVSTCPGLYLSWAITNVIPSTDFSKTEDLPEGTFNVVNGAKLINTSGGGVTLRVQISTNSTASNDMSYSLDNLIETYLVKTYETKQIILFNGDSTVDSQFQYTDENGIVNTPTVTAGVNLPVCARLSCPTPTVLSGDGIIELTLNDCP